MLMPETIQDRVYLNQTEAAQFLGITNQTFRKKNKEQWRLHWRKNPRDDKEKLYLKSDLEKLTEIGPAEGD